MIKIKKEHYQYGIVANQTSIVNNLLDHYVIEEEDVKNAEQEISIELLRQLVNDNYNSFEELIMEIMTEYDSNNYEFLMLYSDWNGEYSELFIEELRQVLLSQMSYKDSLLNYSAQQIKDFSLYEILKHIGYVEHLITYENSVQNRDLSFDEDHILLEYQDFLVEKFEDDLYLVSNATDWILVSSELFTNANDIIKEQKIPYILYQGNIWLGFDSDSKFKSFLNSLY